jgi:hypothetical protein
VSRSRRSGESNPCTSQYRPEFRVVALDSLGSDDRLDHVPLPVCTERERCLAVPARDAPEPEALEQREQRGADGRDMTRHLSLAYGPLWICRVGTGRPVTLLWLRRCVARPEPRKAGTATAPVPTPEATNDTPRWCHGLGGIREKHRGNLRRAASAEPRSSGPPRRRCLGVCLGFWLARSGI